MTLTTEQDKAFRLAHITASEVSALVGMNPYDTPWSLYQKKIGAIEEDDFEAGLGERQRWGLNLERAIINETGLRLGRVIRKWTQMPLSDGLLGAHPDAREVVSNKTRSMVELKTVDGMIYYKDWEDGPPDHYIIQLQVQMGLAQVQTGFLSVLIGGNDLKIFEYDFRPDLFAFLHEKARAFRARIEARDAPPVNFEKDLEAIEMLYRSGGKGVLDITGDNLFPDACQRYLDAHADETEAKKRKEQAKAEIKYLAQDYDVIHNGEWQVKFSTTAPKPDYTITADMVGTLVKGRAGSRSIGMPKLIKGK